MKIDQGGEPRGLTIRRVPIAELHNDPSNVRLHDQRNLDAIRASLKTFGQVEPLVVQKGTSKVIGGNGRLEAMRAMGLAECDIVEIDADNVTATGLAIALNRTASLAAWDETGLAEQLEALRSEDFDLDAIGFTDDEVDSLLEGLGDGILGDAGGDDAPAPVDKADELREKWRTEPGQLWAIPSLSTPDGEHRLLCGDSTRPEDVARVMAGEKALLMNTDPPYGVDYAATKQGIPRSGFKNIQQTHGDIENDDLAGGAELQAFLESMIKAALPHLVENPAFYFWHPMLTQGTFFAAAAAAAAAAADILIHRQIIWVKPGFVLTRSGMYHWKHELCFYGWIRGKPCPWLGDKSQTSVWEIGRDDDAGMHPTQKPVELFIRPIQNHTRRGDAIYEPFSGSGSQLVAAERTGRLCRAIELSPKFAAVALERLAGLGLEPRPVK